MYVLFVYPFGHMVSEIVLSTFPSIFYKSDLPEQYACSNLHSSLFVSPDAFGTALNNNTLVQYALLLCWWDLLVWLLLNRVCRNPLSLYAEASCLKKKNTKKTTKKLNSTLLNFSVETWHYTNKSTLNIQWDVCFKVSVTSVFVRELNPWYFWCFL